MVLASKDFHKLRRPIRLVPHRSCDRPRSASSRSCTQSLFVTGPLRRATPFEGGCGHHFRPAIRPLMHRLRSARRAIGRSDPRPVSALAFSPSAEPRSSCRYDADSESSTSRYPFFPSAPSEDSLRQDWKDQGPSVRGLACCWLHRGAIALWRICQPLPVRLWT